MGDAVLAALWAGLAVELLAAELVTTAFVAIFFSAGDPLKCTLF